MAQGVPSDLWQELLYLDFRGAGAKFESYLAEAAPGSPEWEEATLGLAVCYHQRQPDIKSDKEKAAELYRDLIKSAKATDVQVCASLYLGRLEQRIDYFGDEPNSTAAIERYEKILTGHPSHSLAQLAALYRAQSRIFTMEPAEASKGIEELQDWIDKHPDPSYEAIQWILIGKAWMSPLDGPSQALAAYENALAAGLPQGAKLDAIFWLMANLAEKSDQTDKAILYYTRLMKEVDRSSYGYDSQLRIKRLGGTPPELTNPFAPPEAPDGEGS